MNKTSLLNSRGKHESVTVLLDAAVVFLRYTAANPIRLCGPMEPDQS